MKVRLITFLIAASAALAACSSGSSSGSAGGPVQPGPPSAPSPPPVPVAMDLAAFARAGMVEAEDTTPRALNEVELVSNEDNPSEFDDWFQ
jgi:ABC-type glycerol-3-phosphate transport system substrate-binding protein